MPRLYNLHPSPVVVDIHKEAVPPGGAYDFTEEQAAGLGDDWSAENPRAGLEQERAFWARRKREAENDNPARPEGEDNS